MASSPNGAGGTGTPQGQNPPMGGGPIEGFLQPPGLPGSAPVLVPVPPAAPKPTIPKIPLPTWQPDEFFDWIGEHAKKGSSAFDITKRIKDRQIFELAKARRGNIYGLGFELGWEIGDYLFPVGHWIYGNSELEFAGYNFPANWVEECHSGGSPTHWRSGSQAVTSDAGWSSTGGDVGTPTGCGVSDAIYVRTEVEPDHVISSANFTRVTGFEYKAELSPSSELLAIYEQVVTYEKRFGSTGPQPEPVFELGTGTVLQPWTTAYPSELPESFPLGVPMPIPYGTPWADAAPAPGSQGEGLGNPLTRTGVGVPVPWLTIPLAPVPVVDVVNAPPGAQPPVQVITVPRGGGSPRYHREPPRGRQRPRKRHKEKKLSVHRFGMTWAALNLATEVFDFIDAMHEGLPKEKQCKAASIDYGKKGGGKADPYCKLLAIWNHFDSMDWDKATVAFINNQIEDMVVGMLGAAGTKANKLSGAATGGGGAVQSRPQKAAEAASDKALEERVRKGELTKAEAKALDERDDLPIPKMRYEDGQWILEIPPNALTG